MVAPSASQVGVDVWSRMRRRDNQADATVDCGCAKLSIFEKMPRKRPKSFFLCGPGYHVGYEQSFLSYEVFFKMTGFWTPKRPWGGPSDPFALPFLASKGPSRASLLRISGPAFSSDRGAEAPTESPKGSGYRRWWGE